MQTLDWLQSILENKSPLPSIGEVVHAKGDVVGLVVGYRQMTPQSPMGALVQNVNTGNLVMVLSEDVISHQDAEGYVAERRRPALRLVHSEARP